MLINGHTSRHQAGVTGCSCQALGVSTGPQSSYTCSHTAVGSMRPVKGARSVTHITGDVTKCSGCMWLGGLLPCGEMEVGLKHGKDRNEQVDVVDTQTHLQTDSREALHTPQQRVEIHTTYAQLSDMLNCANEDSTYISCNAFKFDALLLVAGNAIRMQACRESEGYMSIYSEVFPISSPCLTSTICLQPQISLMSLLLCKWCTICSGHTYILG